MANPQAFPHGDPTNGGDLGMTLRDYFAAAALQGFVTSERVYTDAPNDILANQAYELADAMLAERSKK